jgi:hypothetical protein
MRMQNFLYNKLKIADHLFETLSINGTAQQNFFVIMWQLIVSPENSVLTNFLYKG